MPFLSGRLRHRLRLTAANAAPALRISGAPVEILDAVGDAERRLKRVEGQILALLSDWSLSPIVDALQAMRGIAVITAVVLVAEVGDFTRFTNPRQLMATSAWFLANDRAVSRFIASASPKPAMLALAAPLSKAHGRIA